MNFRKGKKRGAGGGAMVDLTPLIDVTFQLLIFFLLTIGFWLYACAVVIDLKKAD